jgi:hypothetical protein
VPALATNVIKPPRLTQPSRSEARVSDSGRAARHPRKPVIHGTGTISKAHSTRCRLLRAPASSRGPNDRLEAYAVLVCAVASSRWVRGGTPILGYVCGS